MNELLRFATEEELKGYLDFHQNSFLGLIRGLQKVELLSDELGSYLRFEVTESPADLRDIKPEMLDKLLMWPVDNPRVQARFQVVIVGQDIVQPPSFSDN